MTTTDADQSNTDWFRGDHGNSYQSMGRQDGFYEAVAWRPSALKLPVYFHYQASIFGSEDQAVRARKDGVYYTQKQYRAQKESCGIAITCQILGFGATIGQDGYNEIYAVYSVSNILVEIVGDTPVSMPASLDSTYTTTMASLLNASLQTADSVTQTGPPPTGTSTLATPSTTLVVPPPVPTPQPTAVPPPTLTIDQLNTYDNGHQSSALYHGNPTQFVMHYRLDNASASGKATAIFQVSGAAGALLKYTQPLPDKTTGTVKVQVGGILVPGRRMLEAWVWIGPYHAYSSTSFTVFNPSAFQTAPSKTVVERYHICCAYVEGNPQAQAAPYTLHFDPLSYQQEGRQTGYYETVQLAWPSINRNITTVRSDLVSIYGTPQQAQRAFQAQKDGYDWAMGGNCSWCASRIQPISTDGWKIGDCCRAAYVNYYSSGVDMEETFFVRGQVLIQVWSWWASDDPQQILNNVELASAGGAGTLDYVAWQQQQP